MYYVKSVECTCRNKWGMAPILFVRNTTLRKKNYHFTRTTNAWQEKP